MKRIYLDNAATTQLLPEVLAVMHETLQNVFGNPSSIHAEGRKARSVIEDARKIIAKSINASLGEVFFTSGGTEACNMILRNAVRDLQIKTIISSPIEHHCVLHTLDAIEKQQDIRIVLLPVDSQGIIALEDLAAALQQCEGKALVSLMHGNNEIGNLLDIEAVGALCAQFGAYFHTDTVQTFGKLPIDVQKAKIHFLQGSAHKIHGPKGVGFMFMSADANVKPYITGGSQERNVRAGTENISGIVGFAKATEIALLEMDERNRITKTLRDYLQTSLRNEIEEVQFNGDIDGDTLHNILSVSFPDNGQGDMLLFNLDIEGISASGGSACSSGIDAGSHVIAALGGDYSRSTIRFSMSKFNTHQEIDQVVGVLKRVYSTHPVGH